VHAAVLNEPNGPFHGMRKMLRDIAIQPDPRMPVPRD
jgi:hypothetical protein